MNPIKDTEIPLLNDIQVRVFGYTSKMISEEEAQKIVANVREVDNHITVRPIPITNVGNDTIRRILIIALFIPITIIGWVLHTIRAVGFFSVGLWEIPKKLYDSGVTCWRSSNEPN